MKVFTYSEARQNLAKLLSMAQYEDIQIKRKDGSRFVLRALRDTGKSPFEVEGVKTGATTEDILAAVSESRSR